MEKKNLKQSLLLPVTNFPIRNKKEVEKQLINFWEEKKIYSRLLSQNIVNNKRKFVIHDGPPYANGSIHVGHLVNRILKDFVVRFHNLIGYQVFFKLGWDTHGLPIEFKVISSSKNEIPREKVRELCRKYANEQVEIQRNQLKELALFANYENNYSTDNNSYEATQLSILAEIVERKFIYRGLRPVYWSWSQQTALAENEVEYKEKEDFSLFFKLELKKLFLGRKNVKMLIWTTQPWTIPANMFIGVKPSSNYSLLNREGELLVCSEEYTKTFTNELVKVLQIFTGNELLGLEYFPLYPGIGPFIIIDAENLVKIKEGTGILHLAPACGMEDFLLAQQQGVKIVPFIDEKGNFFSNYSVVELAGVFYQEANQWIINDLRKRALVLTWEKFTHSYPHDWRDGSPLIYLLTSQWFIDLTKIRQNLLTNIENVEWIPTYSREKMLSFIRDRNEWCISRQRKWGVPIPVIYKRGEVILDLSIIRYVAKLVAKEGSDFWFQKKGLELIKREFSTKFGEDFTLGTDTLDVWFDSGVSSFCVLDKEGNWPADIYLEGSDQFRGWFNSSLILSTIIKNSPPYRRVVSHGFVVDEDGRKMSKSLGNVIEPQILIEQFGINTLRWWVASVDFTKEMKISNKILFAVQENYQKLRNCLRFISASLYQKDESETNEQSFSNSHGDIKQINDYIRGCLVNFAVESRNSYLKYNFVNIYNLVNDFSVNKLSTFYFEIIKDLLYCDHYCSQRRKIVLQILNEILKKILVIIIPLLPSLAEEIYQTILSSKESFVFKDDKFYSYDSINFVYEKQEENLQNPQFLTKVKDFEEFILPIRKSVFRELEKARQSGIIETNQQAIVTLSIPNDEKFSYFKVLFGKNNENSQKNLSLFFIVAEVNIKSSIKFSVEVKKSLHLKCQRCWRFIVELNYQKLICLRCIEVLNSKGLSY